MHTNTQEEDMNSNAYSYDVERALFVAFGQFFTMLEGSAVAEGGMGAVSSELDRLLHFDVPLRCVWTELFDDNLWARERLVCDDPRTSFSPASVPPCRYPPVRQAFQALAATATSRHFEQLLSSLSVSLAPRADPGWSKALRLYLKARNVKLDMRSGGMGASAHHKASGRRDRARSRRRGYESGSDGLDSEDTDESGSDEMASDAESEDDMEESGSEEMESDAENAGDETSSASGSDDVDSHTESGNDMTTGVGFGSGGDARSAPHLHDDARHGSVSSKGEFGGRSSSITSASDSGAEDGSGPTGVTIDLPLAPLELMAAVCADVTNDKDHASDVNDRTGPRAHGQNAISAINETRTLPLPTVLDARSNA